MKASLIALLVAIVCCAVLGFTSIKGGSGQTMSVPLKVKDLPGYGLYIVAPSDSPYDELISALIQDKPNPVVEVLRPYSVFVKNNSGKRIVACQLKWEVVKPNGRVQTIPSGFISMERLTRQGVSGVGDYVIEPNESWFFTPSAIDVPQGDNLLDAGDSTPNPPNEIARRMQSDYLLNFSTELAQSASINVSIDGVFFTDGTFAGTDSMHLFERVVASRDARRDLLRELEQEAKQGKSANSVFKRVEQMYPKPSERAPDFTTPEFYAYYKRAVARELLSLRKLSGDELTLKSVIAQSQAQWTELKKLDTGK